MSEQSKIGKFDSVDVLYKAYLALESEFTKRSQKVAELTRQNEKLAQELADEKRLEDYAAGAVQREDFQKQNILCVDGIKTKIITEYLENLNSATPSLLKTNVGKSITTPPNKPRTLSEAKKLAEKYFN